MKTFNDKIKAFIKNATWTYAKTMPEWPHEYIVKYKVDNDLFVETAKHIREFGYQGSFYDEYYTFFEEDGMVYWTMGEPIDETIIINRCKKEATYETRLKNGTLP